MLTLGGKVNLRRTEHKIVRHFHLLLMYLAMHYIDILFRFKMFYKETRNCPLVTRLWQQLHLRFSIIKHTCFLRADLT